MENVEIAEAFSVRDLQVNYVGHDALLIARVHDATLGPDQRKCLTEQIREAVGYRAAVLVADETVDIDCFSPCCVTKQMGDLRVVTGFATPDAMRRWLEREQPGLWYDWHAAVSNDPKWGDRISAGLVDAKTGESVEGVVFYHSGTKYLERLARKLDGSEADHLGGGCMFGVLGVIVETRELLFVNA